MKIAGRAIGPDTAPYIVAEISANHVGDADTAKRSIIEAANAGADAVKIQCYTADSICADTAYIIPDGPWAGRKLFDLYGEASTPPEMVRQLFEFARCEGITLFASAFSFRDVDIIVDCGTPAIKIASFEITDTPLIRYAASMGLPMIISTGMASSLEISDAVNAVNFAQREMVCGPGLALLHCVSNYPAAAHEANLPQLGTLSSWKDRIVGFSDHTLGLGTACGAVAFGAAIIEKHFILDRALGGPDSHFSMEPDEFKRLAIACKETWEATRPSPTLVANQIYRKSIYVTKSVAKGSPFSPENLGILRPGFGLSPSLYGQVLASVATRDLQPNTPLDHSMVEALS